MTVPFNISAEDWALLKIKLLRKYNHLSDQDLAFEEGQEDELVTRLARRLRRDRDYVFFTLGKEVLDLHSNRL